MRSDELSAITQALAVIEGVVATKATETGVGGRDTMGAQNVNEDAPSYGSWCVTTHTGSHHPGLAHSARTLPPHTRALVSLWRVRAVWAAGASCGPCTVSPSRTRASGLRSLLPAVVASTRIRCSRL